MSIQSLKLAPLMVAFALAAVATGVRADPPRTPGVQCTAGGLREHPHFTQVSPGRAEYNFSGVCTTREGDQLGYRIDATWTPSETSGNANASEVYHVDRLSGPSQSYTAIVGWHCNADPWLQNADCTRVGDNIPDEPSSFWEEFGRDPAPSSRLAIPRDQRAALLAEYQRANGIATGLRTLTGISSQRTPSRNASAVASQDGVRTVGDEVALNPQPLPPEPDPDPNPALKDATNLQGTHAETSIIIVGGTPEKTRQVRQETKQLKTPTRVPMPVDGTP